MLFVWLMRRAFTDHWLEMCRAQVNTVADTIWGVRR